jgi:N utilization substance protein A
MNEFIINAMAPVRVISVDVDEENNEADIIVPNEQSSLAIGRQGMAARLVANLLHMKINIIPLTQAEELGIEVKWNGNISPAEVESKEFLENTQRRRTNARRYQPHQNFENQEPAQEPVDLENLQAFQDELLKTEAEEQAAKEEAQLMRSRAQEAKTREAETEEMSKALEDLQKNLAAIDDVLNSNSDDEDYDDYDDEDIESDDYDEYYDK